MKAKNNGKSLFWGILLTLAVCAADFLIVILYLSARASGDVRSDRRPVPAPE